MLDSPLFTPDMQARVFRVSCCTFFVVIFIIAYLIAKELNKKR